MSCQPRSCSSYVPPTQQPHRSESRRGLRVCRRLLGPLRCVQSSTPLQKLEDATVASPLHFSTWRVTCWPFIRASYPHSAPHPTGAAAPPPPSCALRTLRYETGNRPQMIPSGPVLAGTCGFGDTASTNYPSWNVASANPTNPVAKCGACIEVKCAGKVSRCRAHADTLTPAHPLAPCEAPHLQRSEHTVCGQHNQSDVRWQRSFWPVLFFASGSTRAFSVSKQGHTRSQHGVSLSTELP